VLEDQRVSGLAGHLARGGVWVVGDYLDGAPPSGPADYGSPAEYYATMVDSLAEDDHRAIRERAAAVAAVGRLALVTTLNERLDALETRLRSASGDQLIAVIGAKVLRLDDYLATRIIEQVVHLDDLARSVGHGGWPVSAEAEALVIAVGAEIGRRRGGATAMVRALYRSGFTEPTLPVL
jgi:hypothetical protein